MNKRILFVVLLTRTKMGSMKGKKDEENQLKIYQINYFCMEGHHYSHPGKILVVAKNPYESLKKLKSKMPGLREDMFERPGDYVRPIEEIIKENFNVDYKIYVKKL